MEGGKSGEAERGRGMSATEELQGYGNAERGYRCARRETVRICVVRVVRGASCVVLRAAVHGRRSAGERGGAASDGDGSIVKAGRRPGKPSTLRRDRDENSIHDGGMMKRRSDR